MNDFKQLASFLNKYSKIICKKTHNEYTGYIYTVDPVSLR